MLELDDRADYAARAARASKLAETVTDPVLAAIHRRLADSYLELVELTPESEFAIKRED